MNENNNKLGSMIRATICLVVMAVVILGWLEIIPSTIGIIISSVLLCGVSVWSGLEALKEGKKMTMIFNFIMAGLLVAICAVGIFLK